ncbi:MAG TPA: hypothetical protein PKB15_04815, partial [Acidimicrobiia bacterium]|nr:hypothetical protein [Acidimicrobiia bacterium]
MVRAGSIKHVTMRERIIKGVCILIVVALFAGLGVGIFGALNSEDATSTSTPATSTSLPAAMKELVDARPYAVSQPEKVPTGYVRTHVELVAATRARSGCEEILQNYQRTAEDDIGYIDIYSYAATCAFPRPDDAETYTVGDYAGWISESDTNTSVLFELTVNQATVRIETDLTADQMKPILAKFVPFKAAP